MKKRLRVVVADDHPLVLEGLLRILEPDFEVVGAVADGEALVAAARTLQPDIVVADVSMPLLSGIEAVRLIRQSDLRVVVIFLTMHPDSSYAKEALAAGGSGYVLKTSAGDELINAIGQALEGKVFITPLVSQAAAPEHPAPAANPAAAIRCLTARQREVLRSVAEGRTAKEIAGLLQVSPRTVEFHKYRLMSELAVRTTAELIQFAIKCGVV